MKRNDGKVVWLNRGHLPVYYGLCPSRKAWEREIKRFSLKAEYPTADGNTMRFTNERGELCIIVNISERFEADKICHNGMVGLLVHEAMHVWQFILEDIGEDEPSKEFEAYSMQAISQELISAFCDTRFDLFRKPQ